MKWNKFYDELIDFISKARAAFWFNSHIQYNVRSADE